ncbi:bifunctional 4-hydroxy-2-oxoglutarate aldolase/2-dehydro-3-deoxy-phosphogluconate aldolase [Planctomycetota bacterium]
MSKHSRLHTLTTMKKIALVPLFYTPDVAVAQGILAACYDGGAHVLEFTNRGDRAIEVFKELTAYRDSKLPDLVLGVGSVCNAGTAAMYMAVGADFIVAPMLDPETAKTCNSQKIPYLPGCGSVTEIHQAHLLGVEVCKIFPAGQVGGPAFIKSIKAPCRWAELMPSGGVAPTRENLSAWFDAGVACVGMGSKLISKDLIEAKDFKTLSDRIKETLALIKELRQ